MSGPADILPDERQARLRQEAREWVVHMRSGEATVDDAASLRAWRDTSPAHAAALNEAVALQRLVRAAGQAEEYSDGPAVEPVQALPSGRPATLPGSGRGRKAATVHSRRAVLGGTAVAASVAGALAVFPPLGLWPSVGELNADYRTAAGQRRSLALARGIALELNTRTSLDLGTDGHSVRLLAGEAMVSAAAGASIRVEAGEGEVTARDARFALRLDGGQACVTCVAGAVDVSAHGQTRRLGANQQVRYDTAALLPVEPVEPDKTLAWRRGLLIFKDEPLGAVVAELNRYYPGRILVSGKALAATPVNAVFRIDRIDRAVSQIQGFTSASATTLPGRIILLS